MNCMNIKKILEKINEEKRTINISNNNIPRGINGLLASNLGNGRIMSGTLQSYIHLKYQRNKLAEMKEKNITKGVEILDNYLMKAFVKWDENIKEDFIKRVRKTDFKYERAYLEKMKEWGWKKYGSDVEEESVEESVIDEKDNTNLEQDLVFNEVERAEEFKGVLINCEKMLGKKRSFFDLPEFWNVKENERDEKSSCLEILKKFKKN